MVILITMSKTKHLIAMIVILVHATVPVLSQHLDSCKRFESVFPVRALHSIDIPKNLLMKFSFVSVHRDTIHALVGYRADSGFCVVAVPYDRQMGVEVGRSTLRWLSGQYSENTPRDFLATDSSYAIFLNTELLIAPRSSSTVSTFVTPFLGGFGSAFSDNGTDIICTRRILDGKGRKRREKSLPTVYVVRYVYPFEHYDEEPVDMGLSSAIISRGPRSFVVAMRNCIVHAQALHGSLAVYHTPSKSSVFHRIFDSFWSRGDSLRMKASVSRFLPKHASNFIQFVHLMEDSVRTIQRICALNDTSGIVVWNDTGWVRSRVPFGMDSVRRLGMTFFSIAPSGQVLLLKTLQSVRIDDGSPIAMQWPITGNERWTSDGTWIAIEHLPVNLALDEYIPEIQQRLKAARSESDTVAIVVRSGYLVDNH
jgi:hypothetical protein